MGVKEQYRERGSCSEYANVTVKMSQCRELSVVSVDPRVFVYAVKTF